MTVLTGFFSRVGSALGVSTGSQKLGRVLALTPVMLDTLLLLASGTLFTVAPSTREKIMYRYISRFPGCYDKLILDFFQTVRIKDF